MKTPDIQQAGNGSNKQKVQLVVLAGLALALVVILVKQFGQGDEVAQAATAPSAAPVVTAAASSSEPSPAPRKDEPKGNLALAERPADETVSNDAFRTIWAPTESEATSPIEELPPPKIKLNATLVPQGDDELAVAVIDGKLRYVGDNIQGWWLHSIDRRSVALRSPGERIETIAMPLLTGAAANAPRPEPAPSADPAPAESGEALTQTPEDAGQDA